MYRRYMTGNFPIIRECRSNRKLPMSNEFPRIGNWQLAILVIGDLSFRAASGQRPGATAAAASGAGKAMLAGSDLPIVQKSGGHVP